MGVFIKKLITTKKCHQEMAGLNELSFSDVSAITNLFKRVNNSIARKSGISFPFLAPQSHHPPTITMRRDIKRQIEVSGWIEVKGHFISSLACKELLNSVITAQIH